MEADWEFEIGGDAPVIEAYWPGFVNIRDQPERMHEIAETGMLPGLAAALLRLNQVGSPVWTCKTDVFVPEEVDPDELSASREEAQFAIACYIDLLMRGDQVWNLPVEAEKDCRKLCTRMQEIPLRCCRLDLVVRRARVADGSDNLGVTVYLTACGETLANATERLAECLVAFSRLMVAEP
ncbi:MAG TPA: hypothetical protein VGI45_25160 [Terracidiphilus sp.]|jgi:hypothetical protein